jgi:hypothetical protein
MSDHRPPAVLALAASLSLLTFTPALAEWPQGTSVVIGNDGTARGAAAGFFYPGETSDDFYVALVAWTGVGTEDCQVAHLGTDGQLLWSATNVHLVVHPTLNLDPGFAPTGLGGFVNAFPWDPNFTGTYRIGGVIGDVQGVTSPPWPYLTFGNSAGSNSFPSCCRADGGGAYVTWMGQTKTATGATSHSLRIQRLDASGAIAPGWPDTGWKSRPVISGQNPLQTAADGSGGLLVAGFFSVGYIPFVHRIRGDTTVATGWPAAGLPLISSGTGNPTLPLRLVRSGANHFVAAWVGFDLGPGGNNKEMVVCQRFSLAGSLDPAWPPDGVLVETGMNDLNNLTCVEDGAGGVTVGWSETARYRVRHIRADGTTPGLYAGGPLSIDIPEVPNMFHALGAMARGQSDGSCVFWNDNVTGIRGLWLDGDGNALGCGAPDDTCSALILADTQPRVVGAMADGNGGAYILYGKYIPNLNDVHYVTRTNYLANTTTSVLPAGRTSGLWLAISPNPAAGALTVSIALPDARPARLEVLDLAGRRLLARDLSHAGEHVEQLGALAPGVYVVSVEQGGEHRTARAVVVR